MVDKIVIIGAGFGGLNVATHLKHTKNEVLVLDKTNHHLFQPLLYQVATAVLTVDSIAAPIRDVLKNQSNAKVLMAHIVQVDKEKKEVITSEGDRFPFDYLVIATGARHSYFGHDEWEKDAPGLKTVADAFKIRQKILLAFEHAERCKDPLEARKHLRFIVIGGGPTGVEMAGAIAEIARKTLFKNFRNIRPEQSEIYLIEGLDHILPSYPTHLSEHARRDLEQLGVTVLNGKMVTGINEKGVKIGDDFFECYNIIWAAGNEASKLLKTLGTELDRQGRAIVEPDLSIPGYPNIFVIGDAAQAKDKKGQILPGIAPVAIQQAKYLAKILRKKLPKEKRKPFKYFDKGLMATIGKERAIVKAGKLEFTGLFAWLIWCFIHILYLISYQNRIIVMMQWSFWYLTGRRNVRIITRPIDQDIKID